jgi:RNA polymerase sigma-70 factor (ECF subfamily)
VLADEELGEALAAAVGGAERGFVVLWRALQPALLRYLRVVSGEAAEDVASETWLHVARDLSRFEGDVAAFRVWVFRIARYRGIDEHRRARRRPEEPRELTDGEPPAVRDVAWDVVERDDTDWALRLIASLPPDQGEAVMLRVVAGLDVAQTAQVLGKRSGAVRIATMRGLRRLSRDAGVQARQAARGAGRAGVRPAGPEGV